MLKPTDALIRNFSLLLRILVELFEEVVQDHLSIGWVAGIQKRLDSLFHGLAYGRGIAPRIQPFADTRLNALDFGGDALANFLAEFCGAAFGNLAQVSLLLGGEKVFDPGEQTELKMFRVALGVEDLIKLGAQGRLIGMNLPCQGGKRGGFVLEPSLDLLHGSLRVVDLGVERLALLSAEAKLIGSK
ncbi:MAG: hypothetical protein JO170_24205 [Verrucomicrobia bacterium]|nr:hypothetical protein [Verrucomicrobiota bacterium]